VPQYSANHLRFTPRLNATLMNLAGAT